MPPKILVGAASVAVLAWAASEFFSVRVEPPGGPTFDVGPPLGLSDVPYSVVVQIAISLILLAAALWVVLSQRYQPTDRHWAYGIIGTVVGFWLHS